MKRNERHYAGPIEHSTSGGIGCGGKRAYSGFVLARRMAQRTSRALDRPMQPYRCARCGSWHVGTPKEVWR